MTATTATVVRGNGRKRASTRPPWEESPTAAGQVGKTTVIAVILAVIIIPLYSIILTSFSTQKSINIAGGMVLVPHGVTAEAYNQILHNQLILHSLLVSVGITFVGTTLSMVVTVLCAYGLSRPGSFGHRTILMTLVVTMFFSGGLIPGFLVVSGLGGYGKYWALILPSAVSVFNIIVMRAFFSSTAQEMMEAARLDGAGDWRIMWSVVLPTSKAVLAVITLFYAVAYWNSIFNVVLYLPDNNMWPMQMVIYTYTLQGSSMAGSGVTGTGQYAGHQALAPLSLQMAVVTLTLIPIMIVYPFVQKHFTKGMLTGAIKG